MKTDVSTIAAKFKSTVTRHRDATAIIDCDFTTYTYSEFDSIVEGVRTLLPEGAERVGILMGHGVQQVASLFAIIESGAACVAVEPALPGERIRRIFTEAKVDCVLTGHANATRVADFHPIVVPGVEALKAAQPHKPMPDMSPLTRAYILYTARRDGKRKGVIVDNGNVTHYVKAFSHEFNLGPGDVMLQSSVCTYDTFVEEVFVSLLSGATLAILPERCRGDVRSIVDFAERTGVTAVSAFTTMIAETNRLQRVPSKLRLIIANGTVLTPGDISWLKDHVGAIYFSYGLSETTVRAAWMRCDNYPLAPGATVYPIGRPVEGVEIAILNENLEPVERLQPGEICILGDGVARGYINEDDDSSNFATMPDGRRVYLTGDLGCTDGDLFYYLRPVEEEVEIDGRKVSCREVESALRQNPHVENGVVCSFTDTKGKPYLVAYFTAKCAAAAVSLQSLKRHMKNMLAWFKVPEFFIQMAALPRKRNGKVSLKDLPRIFKG